MRKRSALFGLLVVASITVFAGESVLETDPSVTIGHLENGLTYYIKPNQFPKNQAVIQLVVKAGSLHEEEHQRGLAHFLEHMLFRGSESFKDWEVIKYLESIGAQFGADTNAYTSADLTVYHFNVPSDKEEILEQGLFILSEYAGKATIDPQLVENEREVVMDEYNLHHRNPNGRAGQELIKQVLEGSRYAERMPIGLESVIRNCDPQTIRDFYEKWYRPDRMAVIVVGDLDTAKVEAVVQKYFSSLKNLSETVEEPDHSLVESDRKCIVVDDSELGMAQTGVYTISENEVVFTEKSVKNQYCLDFFLAALSERLDQLAIQNPAPFTYHGEFNFDVTAFHKIGLGLFVGFEGRELDGLKAYLQEIENLKRFGLTQVEFERHLNATLESIKTSRAQLDRVDSGNLASAYIGHFVNDKPFFDRLEHLNFNEKILSTLTLEDISSWAKEKVDLGEFSGFYLGANGASIDKDAFLKVLEEVEKSEMKESAVVAKKDFVVSLSESEDHSYKAVLDEKVGYKSLILSNGMKVVIQPSQLQKEEVSMTLLAKGGKGLFQAEELASIDQVPAYMIACGLANLDKMEFQKFLQERQVGFNVSVSVNSRSIYVGGRSENTTLMLELLRGAFCDKRFSLDAWENLYAYDVEIEKGLAKDPYNLFWIEMSDALYCGHPFYVQHWAKDAKEDICQKAIQRLFSDPSEFTLVIVGDVELDAVEPLVVKFLSFPKLTSENQLITYAPRGTYPQESQDITIHKGKDSHCVNIIIRAGDFNFEHKKDFGLTMQAFNHAISFRLLEKLRQEMGETYGASAGVSIPLFPQVDEMQFKVYFTAEHANAEALANLAEMEVARFLKDGISEKEISTAKEILMQRYKEDVQSNNHWMGIHQSSFLNDLPVDYFLDFEGNLERQVTKERVDALAKAALADHPVIKVRLLPEKSM